MLGVALYGESLRCTPSSSLNKRLPLAPSTLSVSLASCFFCFPIFEVGEEGHNFEVQVCGSSDWFGLRGRHDHARDGLLVSQMLSAHCVTFVTVGNVSEDVGVGDLFNEIVQQWSWLDGDLSVRTLRLHVFVLPACPLFQALQSEVSLS